MHPLSFIRTMTVGSGLSPDLLDPLANGQRRSRAHPEGHTAGGEFRPALRT
ncbi:hypothetical protein DFP92_101819 [Yoonia sediminilitoris]|uniref:Uncharacterized protein n=1 Tax=Yoonia sediminilitoris TaxID=1286148 RepID=A0A2T6KRS1_9RHOB|nr:hypothetical protein C8N45_101819 [Yoonia sediminilitoris]RCW99393.1 hypothetical protein DFP92_101819 [Yoonia sediminilitoris]